MIAESRNGILRQNGTNYPSNFNMFGWVAASNNISATKSLMSR